MMLKTLKNDNRLNLLNAYNSKFGSGLIQAEFINKKVLNEFKN